MKKIDEGSTDKAHVACREALRKAIEEYERKHGK